MVERNRELTPFEVKAMLDYFNQADPRIESNPANVRIYGQAVGKYSKEVITAAFDYYMGRDESGRKITPGVLRRLCSEFKEKEDRALARAAVEDKSGLMTLREFRERFPGRFLAAYQEGCRQVTGRENPRPPAWAFDDGGSVVRGLSDGKRF